MSSTAERAERVFLDAGLFVAAMLGEDDRHGEAYPIVEAARAGSFAACTEPGVLSEVYGVLTWAGTRPQRTPQEAAEAVRLLVEPPSAIQVLTTGYEVAVKALELAAAHGLTAQRIHDARHAAAALVAGVRFVYTFDVRDWVVFEEDGLEIVGPPSVLRLLKRLPEGQREV
jgi:predicted nucleic acid-binding protein